MGTKKVKMNVSRGNPSTGGAIIRAGAIVDLPEFWADKFIDDGSASEVNETPKQPGTTATDKTKSKK